MAWLRDATLYCRDRSDFEAMKHLLRPILADQEDDATRLETLMGQCLDLARPNDVRAAIVEELVASLRLDGESVLLRQASFYESDGKHCCGKANLDIFIGTGTYYAEQVSLELDPYTACSGYECKVDICTWLRETGGKLTSRCARKLEFMLCVASKLPGLSLYLVSLNGSLVLARAQQTLKAHGYDLVRIIPAIPI